CRVRRGNAGTNSPSRALPDRMRWCCRLCEATAGLEKPRSSRAGFFFVSRGAVDDHRDRSVACPPALRHADGARRPDQTESLATFSGEALTDLLAGFAANCIGSLVKGLTPMRASVAGLLTTDIFTKPGITNSPDSLSSL